MCVEDRLSVELLQQIEHHVRLELFERFSKWGQLVAETDHHDIVAQPAKGLADVVLGLEVRDLLRGEAADVFGGYEARVGENDDSPALYSGCHVSRRCSRCTVCTVNMMAKSSFV